MLTLTDNFQDQMKRELSYREEMVQQLHIVRGNTYFAQVKRKNDSLEKVTPAYFQTERIIQENIRSHGS